MRRLLPFLMIALAFTAIACPPAPPPIETPKKVEANPADQPPPPIETPNHLKDRLDAAIEQVNNRDLLTTHAFWTIFHGILGTGLDKTMLKNPDSGNKVKAIEYICNGGVLRGLQFLPTADGLDVRIGPTHEGQGHQDQFIAEMAQWGMPLDRKFRVGGKDFAFEDFARHSKMRTSVTQKQELTWAIVIISQFYGTDVAWTNNLGEKLRFEDVVRYELDQPINASACGGTHRLFGLTWAYYLHLKKGGKIEGVWKDVAPHLERYKELAHKLQNRDGSLSTDYFKGEGKRPDADLRIGTTGHIVEWLALAMTDDELRSPWMQEAVNALVMMILDMRQEAIDSGSLYHATHGLHLYRDRVFGVPAPYVPLPPKK